MERPCALLFGFDWDSARDYTRLRECASGGHFSQGTVIVAVSRKLHCALPHEALVAIDDGMHECVVTPAHTLLHASVDFALPRGLQTLMGLLADHGLCPTFAAVDYFWCPSLYTYGNLWVRHHIPTLFRAYPSLGAVVLPLPPPSTPTLHDGFCGQVLSDATRYCRGVCRLRLMPAVIAVQAHPLVRATIACGDVLANWSSTEGSALRHQGGYTMPTYPFVVATRDGAHPLLGGVTVLSSQAALWVDECGWARTPTAVDIAATRALEDVMRELADPTATVAPSPVVKRSVGKRPNAAVAVKVAAAIKARKHARTISSSVGSSSHQAVRKPSRLLAPPRRVGRGLEAMSDVAAKAEMARLRALIETPGAIRAEVRRVLSATRAARAASNHDNLCIVTGCGKTSSISVRGHDVKRVLCGACAKCLGHERLYNDRSPSWTPFATTPA